MNGNPEGLQLAEGGKTVRLSQIFDWYRDDFTPSGDVIAFINRFREHPVSPDAKIEYLPYDWSLNEVR